MSFGPGLRKLAFGLLFGAPQVVSLMFWLMFRFLKNLFGKTELSESQSPVAQSAASGKSAQDEMFSNFFREVVCKCESAYRNQSVRFDRATTDAPVVLGALLARFFDLRPDDLARVIVCRRRNVRDGWAFSIIDDKKDMWNTNLVALAVKVNADGYFEKPDALTNLLCCEVGDGRSVLVNVRHTPIVTPSLSYVRICLMCGDLGSDDDLRTLQSVNAPKVCSVLLAASARGAEQALSDYEEVEARTYEKVRQKQTLDKCECEVVHGRFQFKNELAYLEDAKYHMSEKRYYDAWVVLRRAYDKLRCDALANPSEPNDAFATACSLLSECLARMDRHAESIYYVGGSGGRSALADALRETMEMALLGDRRAVMATKNVAVRYNLSENEADVVEQNIRGALKVARNNYLALLAPDGVKSLVVTVGDVLRLALSLCERNVLPDMAVVAASGCSVVQAPADIWRAPLIEPDGGARTFVVHVSHAHYLTGDQVDRSILYIGSNVVVRSHPIGDELFRVDVMLANDCNDDDKQSFASDNVPVHSSFVVGLSDSTLSSCKQSVLQCVELVPRLVAQHRLLEAAKAASWAYGCILHQQQDSEGVFSGEGDDDLNSAFGSMSFWLGAALCDLGRFDAAAYYLKQALDVQPSTQYSVKYLDCLANIMDPNALAVLKASEDAMANSDDPDSRALRMFLSQRIVHILVLAGRVAEAQKRLYDMAEDPDPVAQDFIRKELAFVKKMQNG